MIKMKIVGIIVEYNPFHKGHLYHINKTREITRADYIIAVMSGHFTQRGTPALCDKWNRTKMALKGGIDLLIELPLCFSIRSAEYFAQSSLRLLDSLNIVDQVVFGSELGQIETLAKISSLMLSSNQYYEKRLKNYLKEGQAYPVARKNALLDIIKIENLELISKKENIYEILGGSNNILGIEYLKAKQKYQLNIDLKTIKRIGQNYHSNNIEDKYISATSIRHAVYKNNLVKIKDKIPSFSYKILRNEIKKNKIPLIKDNLALIMLAKLRHLNVNDLKKIHDVNPNLAQRIKAVAQKTGDYNQLISALNTRSYTKTRFQRILLNILFDLDQKTIEKHDRKGPSYLRILGFSLKAKNLLSILSEEAGLPLIYNPSQYLNELSFKTENLLKSSLSYDLYATDIFSLLYQDSSYRIAKMDYKNKIIKMN